MLFVFRHATKNIEKILNIYFPSLGWVDVDHVVTRKMQLIAEAEVNTILACGGEQDN